MNIRRTSIFSLLGALPLLLSSSPGIASPGPLDEQGCHYDDEHHRYHCHLPGTVNPNIYAPAKKTRENQCLDERSQDYTKVKYFVAYGSMDACVRSGGRRSAF